MIATVCEASTVQEIREELLQEILTLIKATGSETHFKPANTMSPVEFELMMDTLIDEYSNKL